jgi:shikimate dehydrogenase
VPRLAVIGYPVGHSRSPAMQTAALEALGLASEWSYGAVEVAPEGFESKVTELALSGYAGLNVTVPHKEAALALADEASDAARAIGAANTLSFAAERTAADDIEARPWIVAENTDAPGLLAALPSGVGSGKALVLGAGGAARAAIWALVEAGGRGVGAVVGEERARALPAAGGGDQRDRALAPRVDVWNRTTDRAAAVAAELGASAVEAPDQSAYELIVNTSAVGLRGEDPFEHLPLTADAFAPGQTIVDMVYGERPSALLAAAEGAGATTVDGLEVLVRQGALSLEIWTGRKAPIDIMRTAARA